MAGSTYGTAIRVTTFGESHGPALGAVLDGFPAGMALSEADIQPYMDRRKPGQSAITTPRNEADEVRILSGVFEGRTTGTPIALLLENTSQRSADYSNVAHTYRPGHADYTYDMKYGFRDYRGGGRSSGRETAGRVAAGAVCAKLLSEMGITVTAYTRSIGPIEISPDRSSPDGLDPQLRLRTMTGMPDEEADARAQEFLKKCMEEKTSAGGVIECRISGVPAGIGEPVFDKLDAELAKAVMSIGAVKAVEIGDGCKAAGLQGQENNDAFRMAEDGSVCKKTNHAGGILGGISDGSDILLRASIKPTPSIFRPQETVTDQGEETKLLLAGRHDPVIVPRAVVVVEAMCAITILDAMIRGVGARADQLISFYRR